MLKYFKLSSLQYYWEYDVFMSYCMYICCVVYRLSQTANYVKVLSLSLTSHFDYTKDMRELYTTNHSRNLCNY